MPSVILVNVWKGIPFFTLNLLAGLKAIDNDLYEAASVDGANSWQKFTNVTLPGLRYVLLVTTLLSTIWTFNTFDVIYLLTGGGPGGSTRPFVVFAYEKAIQGLQFGPGAAVALLMVPILGVFIFFLARYMRRADQHVAGTSGRDSLAGYTKPVIAAGVVLVLALFASLLINDPSIALALRITVVIIFAVFLGRLIVAAIHQLLETQGLLGEKGALTRFFASPITFGVGAAIGALIAIVAAAGGSLLFTVLGALIVLLFAFLYSKTREQTKILLYVVIVLAAFGSTRSTAACSSAPW